MAFIFETKKVSHFVKNGVNTKSVYFKENKLSEFLNQEFTRQIYDYFEKSVWDVERAEQYLVKEKRCHKCPNVTSVNGKLTTCVDEDCKFAHTDREFFFKKCVHSPEKSGLVFCPKCHHRKGEKFEAIFRYYHGHSLGNLILVYTKLHEFPDLKTYQEQHEKDFGKETIRISSPILDAILLPVLVPLVTQYISKIEK